MPNKNKPLTPAQIKALRVAFAKSPGSISSPNVNKATMFALAERKLLVATYTPFHSATDHPTFRISNAGREMLAEIDAVAKKAATEAAVTEEVRAAERSTQKQLTEEKIVEGLIAGLKVFHR